MTKQALEKLRKKCYFLSLKEYYLWRLQAIKLLNISYVTRFVTGMNKTKIQSSRFQRCHCFMSVYIYFNQAPM